VTEAQGKLPPRDTGFGRQDFGSNQRQQQQQPPPAWQDQVIHPLFMVALLHRATIYIFILSFVLLSFFLV